MYNSDVLTVLNKILITYISRQSKLPLTINSNDAQACCDRIVMRIASLALQRIVLRKESAFSMTNTLHQYSIRYINRKILLKNSPIKGSGQGHVAGPTIRVMISAILLTIKRDEDFGVDALLNLSQLSLVIAIFFFVDDMYITNAAKSVKTRGEDYLKQQ